MAEEPWPDLMHMPAFFIGGIVFVLFGAVLALFRGRWSSLFSRLENYAKVPEPKRRSRPINFLVAGIGWVVVGVGWIVLALVAR